MKSRFFKLIQLTASVVGALALNLCYYDNTPPLDSELNDIRPRLVIKLSGFAAGVTVRVRYWSDSQPRALPASYPLKTDIGGGGHISLAANVGAAEISYMLFVDQNNNSAWDIGDFGIVQSGLLLDGEYTYANVAYSAATLASYSTLSAAPAPGQGVKVCMYSPIGLPPWISGHAQLLPEYPDFGEATLTLDDWLVTSKIDSSGGVPAYLPPGNYYETCVSDANSDGVWSSGEAVSAASPVTVP